MIGVSEVVGRDGVERAEMFSSVINITGRSNKYSLNLDVRNQNLSQQCQNSIRMALKLVGHGALKINKYI